MSRNARTAPLLLLAALAATPVPAQQAAPAPTAPSAETAAPTPAPAPASTPAQAQGTPSLPPPAPDAAQNGAPPSAPAPAPTHAPATPPSGGAAPVQAQPSAPAPASQRTLLAKPGEPNEAEEVELPSRPVAILKGASTWDDSLTALTAAFADLQKALSAAGLVPDGRPLASFDETDDDGFRFSAMIPLAAAPAPGTNIANVTFGASRGGPAFRFVHKGAYDGIDATYETITAYLDAKGIEPDEVFVEEYVSEVKDAVDPDTEINVFVFRKTGELPQ